MHLLQVSVLKRCSSIGVLPNKDSTDHKQNQQPPQQQLSQQQPSEQQTQQHRQQQLPQQLQHVVKAAWYLKWQLLQDMWVLLLVPVAFAAFVVWNGGIVLGDKAAHAPVRHLMQPLYFVLFCSMALAPFHFSPSRYVVAFNIRRFHQRLEQQGYLH